MVSIGKTSVAVASHEGRTVFSRVAPVSSPVSGPYMWILYHIVSSGAIPSGNSMEADIREEHLGNTNSNISLCWSHGLAGLIDLID